MFRAMGKKKGATPAYTTVGSESVKKVGRWTKSKLQKKDFKTQKAGLLPAEGEWKAVDDEVIPKPLGQS
jgi:hypothetical protein